MWELWKKFTIPGRIFSWAKDKYDQHKASNVPAYGSGGIVTTPHLAIVGDSNESIIPHNGSKRSKSLWYDAGLKMGMFAGGGIPSLASKVQSSVLKVNSGVKYEISIPFSPIIQGGGNIIEQLKAELPQLSKLIEECVEKAMLKNQRMIGG